MDNQLVYDTNVTVFGSPLTKYSRNVRRSDRRTAPRTNGRNFKSPATVGNKMDPRPSSTTCVLCSGTKLTIQLYEGYCSGCCPECRRIDKAMVAIASNEFLLNKGMNSLWKHMENCHGLTKVKTHKGNGTYKGAFAFTLTKSPNDDLTEDDMIVAVDKIMKQQTKPAKRFVWYIEYGDEETLTHPHIHGMYETEDGGRIEAKHWKRHWKIWDEKIKQGFGFRGGYHRPVKLEEDYVFYVRKCADVRHGEFNIELNQDFGLDKQNYERFK